MKKLWQCEGKALLMKSITVLILIICLLASFVPSNTFKPAYAAEESTVTNPGSLQITMNTTFPVGSDMNNLGIWGTDTIYIDWGNGKIVEFTEEWRVVEGKTIKIYCRGNVTQLDCDYSQLSSLNISNCSSLKELNCCNNFLKELNVSNKTSLHTLRCNDNQITQLDVTSCSALKELNCRGNKLKELNVSKNKNLVFLHCGQNFLSKLDVSGNPALADLNCDENQLTYLNISNNGSLKKLCCACNMLSDLDCSSCASLRTVDCGVNRLTFEDLGDIYNAVAGVKVTFAPQEVIEIPETAYEIDLSSQYDVAGAKTVYKWCDASDETEVQPTYAEGGKFEFGEEFAGRSFFCIMTNELSPDAVISTSNVEIISQNMEEGDIGRDENYVENIEVDEGTVFEDEEGSRYGTGRIHLVVGDVAEGDEDIILEAIKSNNGTFNRDDGNYALYEIDLETDDGVKIKVVDGRIRVCLKYPKNLNSRYSEYTYKLYHMNDDGTVEEVEIETAPNGIWFYADDFSPFALIFIDNNAEESASDNSEIDVESENHSGADNGNAILFLGIGVAVIAVGAGVIVIIKRKNKTNK